MVYIEVGAKLLGCHTKGQCHLFEMGVPSFLFYQGFSYEKYLFLFSVFVFFEQSCTY